MDNSWFDTEVESAGEATPLTKVLRFEDDLFAEKPVRPGYWKYEIDYRGRGGALDHYEIRYDAAAEVFRGTLHSTK